MSESDLVIQNIIPQKPPFVMVGNLINADAAGACTTFLIEADNILVYNGEFSEAGLTENIAQTAAAGAGYLAGTSGRPVPIGYIGAIKNLEVFALPKVGDLLTTRIVIENQVFNVTMLSGTVKSGARVLARCEMRIYLNTPPDAG